MGGRILSEWMAGEAAPVLGRSRARGRELSPCADVRHPARNGPVAAPCAPSRRGPYRTPAVVAPACTPRDARLVAGLLAAVALGAALRLALPATPAVAALLAAGAPLAVVGWAAAWVAASERSE